MITNHQPNDSDTEEQEEQEMPQVLFMPSSPSRPEVDTRLLTLYGQIDEEKCHELISGLYYLRESGKVIEEPEKEEDEPIISYTPIKFLISSEGGLVADTFAVYDIMREVQKDCDVETLGVGKVMSAGVLLLAAGTKGKRKIGRNCRMMMHKLTAGSFGHIEEQENNISETRWCQDRYIDILCATTKLSKKKILSIFKKNVDFYFGAEEALKFGIVDEVV